MAVSRRAFLAGLTGATAVPGLASARALWGGAARAASASDARAAVVRPVLVDLGQHCVLRESLLGFSQALAAAAVEFHAAPFGGISSTGLLIVAGATLPSLEFAARLKRCVSGGARVVYESGAAYASAAVFAAEQRLLAACFHLNIRAPLHLWPSPQPAPGASLARYVRYSWPVEAQIRDFSRIIPVSRSEPQQIGSFGETPVACRTRAGRGELIFLGSPLGPHLLAGDPAAHAWLRALLPA